MALDPSSPLPGREPQFADSMRQFVDGMLDDLHVAMPGFIDRIDLTVSPPLADIVPVPIRVFLDEDGVSESPQPYPIITDVPISFPRGGGAFMSFPLKKGDPVLLVFCQRSLDAWIDSDGQTQLDPQDSRRHHISDAIALVGLSPAGNSLPALSADDLVIGLEDGTFEMHVEPGGDMWMKTPKVMLGANNAAKALALAEKVEAELNSQRSWAATHQHPTAGSGPPSPPLSPPPAVGSTASAKVFTDS